MKSSSVAAFVSTIASVMYLPAASRVPTTTLALCTSIATYLSLFIGLSFSVSSCWSSNYNFPPLGAPFHNAYSERCCRIAHCVAGTSYFTEKQNSGATTHLALLLEKPHAPPEARANDKEDRKTP